VVGVDTYLFGYGAQPATGSILLNPTESTTYVLEASWGSTVEQDTVVVTRKPPPFLELSFSDSGIDRDWTTHATPGTPFPVYVAWSGEPVGLEGVEFGVDLDPGVSLLTSEILVSGAVTVTTPPEYSPDFPCFAPAPYQALVRLLLFAPSAEAMAGTSVHLRAAATSQFGGEAGIWSCTIPDTAVPVAPPLPLAGTPADIPRDVARGRIVAVSPNPFNPRTSITLEAGPGPGEVVVYDLSGRRIRTLERWSASGPRTVVWNGQGDTGRRVASGVYLITLRSGGATDVERAVLLK